MSSHVTGEVSERTRAERTSKAAAPVLFAEERAGLTVAPEILTSVPKRGVTAADLAHSVIALPAGAWAAFDFALAGAAALAAHALSPSFAFTTSHARYSPMTIALVYAALLSICTYSAGFYDRLTFNFPLRMLIVASTASVIAVSATALIFSWLRFVQIGRYIVAFTIVFSAASMVLARIVARALAGSRKVRILFAGRPERFARLAMQIEQRFSGLYAAPEILDLSSAPAGTEFAIVTAHCRVQKPDEIIIEDDSAVVLDLIANAGDLVSQGIVIRTLSSVYEAFLQEVPVEIIDSRSLLGTGLSVGRRTTALLKRVVDIMASGLMLIVSAPLMVIVAAIVWATSGGPIVYAQTRIGRFSRPFRIYKFRTMRKDAEAAGPAWAQTRDTRVTRIGRLLRRSRLDELPQLWNILRGDMSFVGPRPERPEFISTLTKQIPHYNLRHLVLPGLTGWAQIRYPYGSTVEDAHRKLCFDLYYIRHYGVFFDFGVFFKTVLSIARGAR